VPSLDWEYVQSALTGERLGHTVVYLASTGSTNDDARRLAQAGEAEGTVVLTDEQTAGRGRAGKARWLTPAGTSIAVSVLLRPRLPPAQLPLLSLMTGLAAAEGIEAATGVACRLKWPNDLVVGERKLGGILVESSLAGREAAFAVAGVGINANLRAAALGPMPAGAMPPTSLLDEAGDTVSREAVIVALLKALNRRYAEADGSAGGQAVLLAAYREKLSTLGREVQVTHGEETTSGVAEDLSDDGALVVRLPDGTRRAFGHGEVTVRARS
jgi:BirA family transcriptional regulator, biotin operon repressor / biotin---[acetyl-CoA-carboxylase] ligase